MSRKECGDTVGKAVLCPLYKSNDFNHSWIRCESHIPDSQIVEIRYANTHRCEEQMHIFCEGCYKRCEHYRAWKHLKWMDEE